MNDLDRAIAFMHDAFKCLTEYVEHGQQKQAPEQAPKPKYKLEAGCKVAIKSTCNVPSWKKHDRWEVLYVMEPDDTQIVQNRGKRVVFCGDGEKRTANNLDVVEPATPEVGDTVEDDDTGRRIVVGCVGHGNVSGSYIDPDDRQAGPFWLILSRPDFTIICKGSKT